MTESEIRKQIEVELKENWEKSKCEKCNYGIDCDIGTRIECSYYKLIDQLIEARKTIQSLDERIQAKDSIIKLLQEQLKAKQESLERFILGERE